MMKQENVMPAIVFGAILTMIVIKAVEPNFRLGELISALATLIAAFVGANAAFSMKIRKEKDDTIKKQRVSVNQTLHLIGVMWNNLRGYKKTAIDVALQTPAPWLVMKFWTPNVKIKLPNEDLLFLLDTKYANLYLELLHFEQCYNITFNTIDLLYKTTMEELQPKIEQLGYQSSSPINIALLEQQLGPVLVNKLKAMTTSVITEVPNDMQKLKALYDKFRTAMLEHFEGLSLPNLEFYD